MIECRPTISTQNLANAATGSVYYIISLLDLHAQTTPGINVGSASQIVAHHCTIIIVLTDGVFVEIFYCMTKYGFPENSILCQRLSLWSGIRATLVGCVVFSVLTPQQARYTDPRLVQCWPAVYDVGPTLNQPWVNVPGLLGHLICDSTGTRSVHLSTCSPSYQKAVSDIVCKVTHTTLITKMMECSCPVFTFIQGDTQCTSYRRTRDVSPVSV